MKAAILTKPVPIEENPLHIGDYPDPVPGPDEVLLEVLACGVCRSNLHVVEGDWLSRGVPAKLPIVPGHEVVGRIVELGPGVKRYRKGDRVGVQPLWNSCGYCEYCLSAREELCRQKHITGETVDGGYAELLVAKENHIYPIPPELSDVEAAPLFCPGITAYHAVLRAEIGPGNKVAVFGIGGVGHMAVQFAKLCGAEVIAVSRNPDHLQLARDLGAEEVVDAKTGDPGESLRSRWGGMDACLVFAPSSAVARQALRALKPGGTLVLGVFADVGEISFFEEKKIVGTVIGPRSEMQEVLRLAAARKVKTVYDVFPLDQAQEALRRLKEGSLLARAVLVTR
ncbi:alcohol dehydrogenase catalytic domain-containing protein [Candidatus Methylacidithermus pantelleriae]|uniref:alcohol dehydrogenase n=1 Tax=Candidatus Methylacidithermus pantelleriae TaxID=2744239 RepID=A0A8J2BRK0_9BACT|nr:alcohol dehydrogenase catalytic domain-containing protein [Candidatus Methylacidithermus pantelleriae]CAF0702030.1 Alcohol dehydrogenase [Candidatus Methylacidithermus pantelleriae]